jgi:subtilisin family serine protease
LHKKGYTGKGINIAIIDQVLLLEHPEYRNSVRYYKEFGVKEGCEKLGRSYEFYPAQYHGPAVASLSVGTNCGSAPDAGLFFFGNIRF